MAKSKSIGKLKKDLDKVFNRYIRFRDTEDGYGVCISCGHGKPFEELDAGHFYAKQGYDGLRYNEDNVHAECRKCNRFDDSHLISYHDNLLGKIGNAGMAKLKYDASCYKAGGFKWNRAELNEKIIEYKNKLKNYE
jgi:hypothetical protein